MTFPCSAEQFAADSLAAMVKKGQEFGTPLSDQQREHVKAYFSRQSSERVPEKKYHNVVGAILSLNETGFQGMVELIEDSN